jgi:hypothetical protein
MFDSNLNGLARNTRFMAEVASVAKGGKLASLGVKEGDFVKGIVTTSGRVTGNAVATLDIHGHPLSMVGDFDTEADFLIFECIIPTAPESISAEQHPLNRPEFTGA